MKTPIQAHPYVTSVYGVGMRINWNTIGPFDEDEYVNKYVIVIIDCFSRFVMLYKARALAYRDLLVRKVRVSIGVSVPVSITPYLAGWK